MESRPVTEDSTEREHRLIAEPESQTERLPVAVHCAPSRRNFLSGCAAGLSLAALSRLVHAADPVRVLPSAWAVQAAASTIPDMSVVRGKNLSAAVEKAIDAT